jgi:hypothetical protein|tara:strand:+ start:1804 stop:3054 length:1251 start_codon:yes stop_codon:yes gene_type:complete
MAIIYSYPVTAASMSDVMVVSDVSAPGKPTKSISVSGIKEVIDVVDSLNSLTGDLNITGGNNITVTPSGQNIEISTSAIDGSGTLNKIPKWSDSDTLTDSIITEDSSATGITIAGSLSITGSANYIYVPKILDENGEFGSANQVLSAGSSGGALSWVNKSSAGGSTGSVQFKNSSGAFTGDSNLIFSSDGLGGTLTVGEAGGDKGIVILEAEDGVGSGILKIGHQNVSNYVILGLGDGTMDKDYGIQFPVTGPGSNNKILESDNNGNLSWISTPTGNSLIAGSGIKIGSGTIQTENLANGGIIYSGDDNELAVDVGASAVTGTLPVTRGGTGLNASTATLHNTLIGNGDSFVQSGTVNSAMQLPAGNTANRPVASEGAVGLIRYNTQTANFEVCKQTTSSSEEYSWYTIDVTVIPS